MLSLPGFRRCYVVAPAGIAGRCGEAGRTGESIAALRIRLSRVCASHANAGLNNLRCPPGAVGTELLIAIYMCFEDAPVAFVGIRVVVNHAIRYIERGFLRIAGGGAYG